MFMYLRPSAYRTTGRLLLIAMFAVLSLGTVNFANGGQGQSSQDYFNGMMTEQSKALSDRVANLEKVLYFVLAATFGVLITNIMGLRNQGIDRKQTRDDRAEDRGDDRMRERLSERQWEARHPYKTNNSED